MISGTSKISLIIGHINGHFWARGPRIYGFSYTKILQKRLESIWEHPGKYYFCISEKQNFENFRSSRKGKSTSCCWNYFLYIDFESAGPLGPPGCEEFP